MGTKRFDRIKEIYNQDMLRDILALGADEEDEEKLTPESAKEFSEAFGLGDVEEEPKPSKTPTTAPKQPEQLEQPEQPSGPSSFTGLTEEEEGEGEEKSPEVPIVMPGSLMYEVGVMYKELGFSAGGKVYEPGATIAKECPRCFYLNRPVTETKCVNCAGIYNQLVEKMELEAGRTDYDITDAIQELKHILGRRNSRVIPSVALEIYNDNGVTTLGNETVRGIEPNNHRILEDAMWYRLNVLKDPETGEPELDDDGMPLKLYPPIYFSTNEITKVLHLSPEGFRSIIDRYNAKLLENLPPEIAKTVKYDKDGEPLPSSKRMLAKHGWVGPAMVVGTGVADVMRSLQRNEPWRELNEKEEAIALSPAFKSIDIAAWKWENTKPAFVTWINYLKEKFFPMLKKYKLTARRKAMENIYVRHQHTANLLRSQVLKLWNKRSAGMRTLYYFEKNPEETRDSIYKKWTPALKTYVDKQKPLLDEVKSIKEGMDKEVLRVKDLLENPSLSKADKKKITRNLKKDFPLGFDEIRALQKAEKATKNIKVPKEIRVLQYLKSNPTATVETIRNRFADELESFMKIHDNAAHNIADSEGEAERFKGYRDNLLIKIQEIVAKPSFDLAEELKKYNAEENSSGVSPDIAKEEKKILETVPPPQPEDPEKIKTSALRIKMLNNAIKARSTAIHKFLKISKEDEDEDVWTSALPEEEPEEPEKAPGMKFVPPKKTEPLLPTKEIGPAGIHEFEAGKFEVKPNEQYRMTISFLDMQGRNKSLSSTGNRFQKPFNEELQNHLGIMGLHNFGVRGVKPENTYDKDAGSWDRSWPSYEEQLKLGNPPGTIITVVVTDTRGNTETYYFDVQESGPIANWYGDAKPTTPRLKREKVIKKEEPEKTPDDTFGNEKGTYKVEFNWTGDYNWSSTVLKKTFSHTPEKSRMGFEDLLKRKIELRFSKTLLMTMHSEHPEYPDITESKHVIVKITEPVTDETKIYSMRFNRLNGEFDWQGTTAVERIEKRRRLKLPENKLIYNLYLTNSISLDELELIGDSRLRDISEPLDPETTGGHVKFKDIKPTSTKETSKDRESKVIESQKRKFETLSKDEQEYQKALFEDGHGTPYSSLFKNMGLVKGKISKDLAPPSEEALEPSPEKIKEETGLNKQSFVVEEIINWRDEVEKKDPRTGKPIYTRNLITGEAEKELIQVQKRTPMYSLVTVTFYKNGKPMSATCQKINASATKETDLGGKRNRIRFIDIWKRVKEEYAPKFKSVKPAEREELYNSMKQEYVSETEKEHPGSSPWNFGKKVQVSAPNTKREVELKLQKIKDPEKRMKTKARAGCKGWPFFADRRLPRDPAKIECFPVQVAVLAALGEETPNGARVWPYKEVAKDPNTDEAKKYTSPEFVADDKEASRFDRIYKLSLMD